MYVREAHAADGAWPIVDKAAGAEVPQPGDTASRAGVAAKCSKALKMTMPLLVDAVDDRVGHAYSGMPDRLYLIDKAGRVAYKGGRGPFGFKPGELEQAVALLLLEEVTAGGQGGR